MPKPSAHHAQFTGVGTMCHIRNKPQLDYFAKDALVGPMEE
jgi:hypothetical protein